MSHKILYGEEGEKLYSELESRLNHLTQEVRDGIKSTDEAVDIFLNELHKKQDEARNEIKSGKKMILTGIVVAAALIAIGAASGKSWLAFLGLMSIGISVAGNDARKKGEKELAAAIDFGLDHFGK